MCNKLYWRVVRLTYPWLPLAIVLWRMTTVGDRRSQLQFCRLYRRIDFATLLAIAIDMIQPEFWV